MKSFPIFPVLIMAAGLLFFASDSFADSADSSVAAVLTVQAIHIAGNLVDPAGKPAADAVITIDIVGQDTNQLVSSRQITPDSHGNYEGDINLDLSHHQWPIIFATEKTNFAPISTNYLGHQTVLQPLTTVRIRLVKDDGKPAGNVRISPAYLIPLAGQALIPAPWSEAVDSRWSVLTDSSGRATLTALPQSYAVILHVDGTRYIEPDINSRGIQLAAGPRTPDQTYRIRLGAAVGGAVFFGATGKPAAGATVVAAAEGHGGNEGTIAITNAAGRYQFTSLLPGKYCIEYDDNGSVKGEGWIAVGRPITIKAGDSPSDVNLTLIHGAIISGTIRDKSLKTPLAQALVRSAGPDHPLAYGSENLVAANAEGQYSIRVAPGAQTLSVSGGSIIGTEAAKMLVLHDGDNQTADFNVVVAGSPIAVSGIVYLPNGSPAANAKIIALSSGFPYFAVSGPSGKFTFQAPGIPPSSVIYARLGTMVTQAAVSTKSGRTVALKLSKKGLVAIRGDVRDDQGRPISGAALELFQVNKDGSAFGIDSVKSDSSGRFFFAAEYGHGDYLLRGSAAGYMSTSEQKVKAAPNKLISLPLITMQIADSFVGGKVIDSNGTPIAGALVSVNQDQNTVTTTDSKGQFSLKNVPRNIVLLHVLSPAGTSILKSVPTGRTDDVISFGKN
jgi:protocatechuate 3,4-dioxygenase beta subunit